MHDHECFTFAVVEHDNDQELGIRTPPNTFDVCLCVLTHLPSIKHSSRKNRQFHADCVTKDRLVSQLSNSKEDRPFHMCTAHHLLCWMQHREHQNCCVHADFFFDFFFFTTVLVAKPRTGTTKEADYRPSSPKNRAETVKLRGPRTQ